MIKICSEKIEEAVYTLCKQANIYTTKDIYKSLINAYNNELSENAKVVIGEILQNIKLSAQSQRPLCQDTGFVTVFVELGKEVVIEGNLLNDSINKAVAKAYIENYFRKSIVDSPIFNRINTGDNTPAIIHVDITEGDSINIKVAIKGCGSENMSSIKMLKPSDGTSGIIDFVKETVKNAGSRPCPPIRLGIGIGGTFEKSAILSKKALLLPINNYNNIKTLSEIQKLELNILNQCNELAVGAAGLGGNNTVLGVNILTYPTHIAAMPVAININCHSSRHAEAVIKQNAIHYNFEELQTEFETININNSAYEKIDINNIEKIRSLKAGSKVLLSGKILTARDAAHKKIIEILNSGNKLPFDIKDKLIYYVGPCPAKNDEVIGPCGPTTSSRMDSYTPILLQEGSLGGIGKGTRSNEVIDAIKKYKGVYFIATGGAANLLKAKVSSAKVIAFEELGPEAVYELEVVDFPVTLAIDSYGVNFIN